MPIVAKTDARVGDVVEVSGHVVGGAPRRGRVVDAVCGETVKLVVRWEDGHEGVLFPGDDVVVRREG